ncbi:hypothetical protein [Streptomyces sp. NPDC000880]
MALRKLTASVSTVWAKATAMVVAVNNRTGELDTNFNGTGELINSDYGVALTGRIAAVAAPRTICPSCTERPAPTPPPSSTTPITGSAPDIPHPRTSQTGTFSVPSDFASAQGYTINCSGQLLISGNTSSKRGDADHDRRLRRTRLRVLAAHVMTRRKR